MTCCNARSVAYIEGAAVVVAAAAVAADAGTADVDAAAVRVTACAADVYAAAIDVVAGWSLYQPYSADAYSDLVRRKTGEVLSCMVY